MYPINPPSSFLGKLHQDFHNPPPPEIEQIFPEVVAAQVIITPVDPVIAQEVPIVSAETQQVQVQQPEEVLTLKEKVAAAEEQKRPVLSEKTKAGALGNEEDDNPMKPISVKSVLKHLKPSQSRYSFRGKDEL